VEKMKIILVTIVLAIICAFVPSRPASGQGAGAQAADAAPTAKHESPFACDRLALTPELRKRHFDVVGPKLLTLKTGVRELPDGYEFSFLSDEETFQLVSEWVIQERACCPFFDMNIRLEREGGPLWLRLTGRKGTKEFIKVDGAKWIR
jgi:hypothetical protein